MGHPPCRILEGCIVVLHVITPFPCMGEKKHPCGNISHARALYNNRYK